MDVNDIEDGFDMIYPCLLVVVRRASSVLFSPSLRI